jgi:hypothetical protein
VSGSGIDPSSIRTVPLSRRLNKVSAAEFASRPARDASFHAFLDSLPDILEAAASSPSRRIWLRTGTVPRSCACSAATS